MGKQVLMLLSKLKYIEIEFYPYLKTKYNQTKCFRLFTHLEENSSVCKLFRHAEMARGQRTLMQEGCGKKCHGQLCVTDQVKKAKILAWPVWLMHQEVTGTIQFLPSQGTCPVVGWVPVEGGT